MPSLTRFPSPADADAGYWRSLADLAGSPEWLEANRPEFMPGVDSAPDGPSRRRFLQVMGASVALAGAAGCSAREDKFVPLSVNISGQIPGTPKYYATAMELGGFAQGLIATSYDGRPIKLDGNPDHPQNRGGSLPAAIASVLELYDPDRSRSVARFEGGRKNYQTWDDFAAFARTLVEDLKKSKGASFRVLAEASSSEALADLRGRLLAEYPKAAWYEYEPVSRDAERAGTTLAFGKPLRVHFDIEKADVIACLDEEILASHPAAVKYAREFAARRRPEDGPMNRLYAVESVFSQTGAMADHRLPLRSDRIASFASALEAEVRGLLEGGKSPKAKNGEALAESAAHEPSGEARFLRVLAGDLVAHKGKGIVAVGPRQPAEVHAVAHRLNALLGNAGSTVTYTAEPNPDRPSHREAIAALATEIDKGTVDTLLILSGNPAYDAPADLKFDRMIEKVKRSIHLASYEDETSRLCKWHVNRAHFLETWGDARAFDGTYTVVQPLIAPLHGGKSPLELLALLLGEEAADGQKIVRTAFNRVARECKAEGDSDTLWRESLDRGLLAGSAATAVKVEPSAAKPETVAKRETQGQGLELVFVADSKLFDGRYANNGWLQELPDFITKLTWDNAALFGPATASKYGVVDGRLIKLILGGKTLTVAANIVPGQAEGSVTLALGYGRTSAGVVGGSAADGVSPIGFNSYTLRTTTGMDFVPGLKVEPTTGDYRLATTQDHHAIDPIGAAEREHRLKELVREGTASEFAHHPEFAKEHEHAPELPLFDPPPSGENHRWGMAIDMSKCVGCNACVVACQSENNIPVVGKEQVLMGREMHWMRIDRYFKGAPEDPDVAHQPIACVQCENAPCEQVCPVAATVHDHEGLNGMVYNRCVGTRYCSNNCPFKVRRFNFFNYHKGLEEANNEIQKLIYNPEVTVRARGVMEKCTYCTHRIQAVKIQAKNEGREVGLEEITPACAQACPSRAIVFGDLNRRESKVSKDHANPRSYTLLAELNVKPRTAHLARIRNPHPELSETTTETRIEANHGHSA
jgi:molybdopterin-containing oxidoreductase family iron-sulfur binding subunit